ncbi:MAG: antibiotic biosynthesis monooxygenase [Maribacter sp.]|nr:antibiotic biosynthesis monooxygenase [Eudoraea sp.]NNK74454.1 antibiotic biosynthesis monooxygenase [Maribacter sp.]
MRLQKLGLLLILMAMWTSSSGQESESGKDDLESGEMMVRIAEIEIEPNYHNEYLAILKEEAAASVRLEPGVICILPMYQKEHPTEIRLLEIYASKEAYESHLQTPHFIHYKKTTLHMVKSLKLIDMEVVDVETMPMIFRK